MGAENLTPSQYNPKLITRGTQIKIPKLVYQIFTFTDVRCIYDVKYLFFATKGAYHIWSNGPALITLSTSRHICHILNRARGVGIEIIRKNRRAKFHPSFALRTNINYR